jgi:hypothetical protein
MEFEIQITHSVEEIEKAEWNSLSNDLPFSSHAWYKFGERAMSGCPPTYLTVYKCSQPIARATFWLVPDEPLPVPRPARPLLQAYIRRRPLFICRSPLSNSSGLALPESPLRESSLAAIIHAAHAEFKAQKGSLLLFDFIPGNCTHDWPPGYVPVAVSDPGMVMHLQENSFEAYLAAGNKKDRQHYRRSLRQAEGLGIRVTRRNHVTNTQEALLLIRNVEKKHGASPNPWIEGMFENLHLVESTWLEARQDGRLVGCGLLLYDQDAQLAAALGLADDVPYAYFQLVYASLQEAFSRQVRTLCWGSGAYEVKRRLGFSPETTNHAIVQTPKWFRPFLNLAAWKSR